MNSLVFVYYFSASQALTLFSSYNILWGSSYYLCLEMEKEVTLLIQDCPGREGRTWIQSQASVLAAKFSLPYHLGCSEVPAGQAKLHVQPNLWASHAEISQEVFKWAGVRPLVKAGAKLQLHLSPETTNSWLVWGLLSQGATLGWWDAIEGDDVVWFWHTYTRINLFNKPVTFPKAIIVCVHTKEDSIRNESRVWRCYY